MPRGDRDSAGDKARSCSARGADPTAPLSLSTSPSAAPWGRQEPAGVAKVVLTLHPPGRKPTPLQAWAVGTEGGGNGSSGLSREGVRTANNKIYPVKSSTAWARCPPGDSSALLLDARGGGHTDAPRGRVTPSLAGPSPPSLGRRWVQSKECTALAWACGNHAACEGAACGCCGLGVPRETPPVPGGERNPICPQKTPPLSLPSEPWWSRGWHSPESPGAEGGRGGAHRGGGGWG